MQSLQIETICFYLTKMTPVYYNGKQKRLIQYTKRVAMALNTQSNLIFHNLLLVKALTVSTSPSNVSIENEENIPTSGWPFLESIATLEEGFF